MNRGTGDVDEDLSMTPVSKGPKVDLLCTADDRV